MSILTRYHIPELLKVFIRKRPDDHNNNTEIYKPELPTSLELMVDPEILSYQILQTLIVKGFQIECDFFLYYLDRERSKLLAIENDADLSQALHSFSDPHLHLIIDLVDYCQLLKMSLDHQLESNSNSKNNPLSKKLLTYKVLSEWDIVTSSDIILAQTLAKTNNFILNQIEKLKIKSRCLELTSKSSMLATNSWLLAETIYQYIMSDDSKQEPIGEMLPFLDKDGRVRSQRNFRVAIYRCGMDPAFRRIGWKHLLNVYPEDFTGQERIDFIRIRCETYRQMRDLWQRNSQTDPEVVNVCNMVLKDVRRTDRHHSFYTIPNDESEEINILNQNFQNTNGQSNSNVISLFNILVTYALNHKYRYCQGMSDLASPLLYVMKDEPHTYITFCALMQRLGENFSTDGEAINRKFRNLKLLLQHYDPEFYRYLRDEHAEELLFSYRWILLDLKREFPFDNVLEILEVLWASIPPTNNSSNVMNLFDTDYIYIPNRNSRDNSPDQKQKIDIKSDSISTSNVVTKNTKPRPKLRKTKFLPNMLSSDSTKITSGELDSPMTDDNNKIHWNEKTVSEHPPRAWNSPNLHSKHNGKFDFDIPGSSYIDVGSSRFYMDVYDDSFSISESQDGSSSSNYDGDGEDEDMVSNKHPQENRKKQESVEKKHSDDVSSCSTFDSGIQRSNTITSYQDDLIQSLKKNQSNDKTGHKSCKINRISASHLHYIVHCNGENCTDDETEQTEILSNTSMDHGYLTDYYVNQKQKSETIVPISRVRSHSVSTKSYQIPPKAKQLLGFYDNSSAKSIDSSSSLKTITSTNSVINQRKAATASSPEIQIVDVINEQFNHLSAKSVSEEILNSAIKRMETLTINSDLSNCSTSSPSSIELIPNPDELLLENEKNKEKEWPLISPEELGPNDAFMLFICLTLLLQNRDYIIQEKMDRNDIQMYFDAMVRKHDVQSVLHDAKHLFHTYLAEWRCKEDLSSLEE